MIADHLHTKTAFLVVDLVLDVDLTPLNCCFFATHINDSCFKDREEGLKAS